MALSRTVLGIFPHPDDESYAAAGSLMLAAEAGARVVVASLTRGEAGEWYKRAPDDRRPLAQVRSEELVAACRLMRAEPPRFLDLPDGQVAQADFPTIVGKLVALIREVRPQVLVALGPDGVYGHPDHVAAYRLVVAAVRSAAGGSRFPQDTLGTPHAVPRLLFAAFPPGLFRPQYDRMLNTELGPAVRLIDPRRLGVPRSELALEVDVRPVAQRKLAVIACHRSQYPGDDPRALFPPGIVDALLAREAFTAVAGGAAGPVVADLFAGIEV
jgi:N-acetyl-1-D-myo-inositol-2-amino-2-deoxy-alpha-D-glucopyranoside deacetylase